MWGRRGANSSSLGKCFLVCTETIHINIKLSQFYLLLKHLVCMSIRQCKLLRVALKTHRGGEHNSFKLCTCIGAPSAKIILMIPLGHPKPTCLLSLPSSSVLLRVILCTGVTHVAQLKYHLHSEPQNILHLFVSRKTTSSFGGSQLEMLCLQVYIVRSWWGVASC